MNLQVGELTLFAVMGTEHSMAGVIDREVTAAQTQLTQRGTQGI